MDVEDGEPPHVQGPVGVVVGQPGVAGCAGGQEGVMGSVGGGEFDQSAERKLL